MFIDKSYKDKLSKYDNKKYGLDFFYFEPTFLCTTNFERWWALQYEARTLSDAILHQYIYEGINEVIRNPKKREIPSKVSIASLILNIYKFCILTCKFVLTEKEKKSAGSSTTTSGTSEATKPRRTVRYQPLCLFLNSIFFDLLTFVEFLEERWS